MIELIAQYRESSKISFWLTCGEILGLSEQLRMQENICLTQSEQILSMIDLKQLLSTVARPTNHSCCYSNPSFLILSLPSYYLR